MNPFTRATIPVLVLLGALLSGPEASAQSPEEGVRSQRHLALGNISFLNSKEPLLQGGYLYQVSFLPSRITVDDLEVTTVAPPRWYLHTLLSGGWTLDSDGFGKSGFAGTGQLGVLYRFDGPATISRVGFAVQATQGLRGHGVVARVGLFHGNAAVSVGWMDFDGPRSAGIVVTVDVLRCILQDLGLVRSCVVS